MKKINKRGLIRILIILLAITMISSVFTGCGFASATIKKDTKVGSVGVRSHSTNQLCVQYKNGVKTIVYNASTDKFSNKDIPFAYFQVVRADQDLKLGGSEGFTFFREIAITMYESVFNADYGTKVSTDDYDTGVSKYKNIKYYYRGDDDYVKNNGSLGKLNLTPIELVKDVNDATSKFFGTNYVDEINKAGQMDADNGLQQVIKAVQATACSVLMTVWAMGFISQVVNEKFTMETLLKTLMQLMCGIILIFNSEQIVVAFASMGNSIINSFGGTSSNTFLAFRLECLKILNENIITLSLGFDWGIVKGALGTVWFDFGCIWLILYLLLPFIALVNCAYKIVSMMIMRMLELVVRITLAPIPLAFGAQQGFSQDAIRYFRGIGACALQPVLIMIGALCIGAIASSILTIFGGGSPSTITGIIAIMTVTMSYFILAGFIGQTKQLAQEIISR